MAKQINKEEKFLLKSHKREIIKAGNFAFGIINQMLYDMILDDIINVAVHADKSIKRNDEEIKDLYNAAISESIENLKDYLNSVVMKANPETDEKTKTQYVEMTVKNVEQYVRDIVGKAFNKVV